MLLTNNWLLAQTDQLVAASNFTVTGLMLVVAAAVIYALLNTKFSGNTDIRFMLMGVLLESLGWAVHRFYWGLWRVYRLYGDDAMSTWFVNHAYLALIPATMIMVGLILIIGPIISLFFNSSRMQSYTIATVLVASMYWFWWWKLGDAFDAARLRSEGLAAAQQITVNRAKSKDTIQPPDSNHKNLLRN